MNQPQQDFGVNVVTLDGTINRFRSELSWRCMIDEWDLAFTDEEITRLEEDFQNLDNLLSDLESAGSLSTNLLQQVLQALRNHRNLKMKIIGARLNDGVETELIESVSSVIDLICFADQESRDTELGEYLAYGAYRAPIYARLQDLFYDQTPPYQCMIGGLSFLTVQMSAVLAGISRHSPPQNPTEAVCCTWVKTPFDEPVPTPGQVTAPGSPDGIGQDQSNGQSGGTNQESEQSG